MQHKAYNNSHNTVLFSLGALHSSSYQSFKLTT